MLSVTLYLNGMEQPCHIDLDTAKDHKQSCKLILTPVKELMGKLLFKSVFKIGDMCYLSVFPEYHCSYVNIIKFLKSDSLLPEIFFFICFNRNPLKR